MDSVYVKCEGLVAKHVFDADLALDSKKGASTRSAAKVESVCEPVCGAFFWKSCPGLVSSKMNLMFRSTLHEPATVCKSFGCNFILWVRHATFKQCRGNSLSGTWKRFLSKAFQTSSIRDVRILPAKCVSVVDTIDFNQFYMISIQFSHETNSVTVLSSFETRIGVGVTLWICCLWHRLFWGPELTAMGSFFRPPGATGYRILLRSQGGWCGGALYSCHATKRASFVLLICQFLTKLKGTRRWFYCCTTMTTNNYYHILSLLMYIYIYIIYMLCVS